MRKRKNRKGRIVRGMLVAVTWLAGITFMLSVASLDSESYVPVVLTIISFAWLMLSAWANGMMYTPRHTYGKRR